MQPADPSCGSWAAAAAAAAALSSAKPRGPAGAAARPPRSLSPVSLPCSSPFDCSVMRGRFDAAESQLGEESLPAPVGGGRVGMCAE